MSKKLAAAQKGFQPLVQYNRSNLLFLCLNTNKSKTYKLLILKGWNQIPDVRGLSELSQNLRNPSWCPLFLLWENMSVKTVNRVHWRTVALLCFTQVTPYGRLTTWSLWSSCSRPSSLPFRGMENMFIRGAVWDFLCAMWILTALWFNVFGFCLFLHHS